MKNWDSRMKKQRPSNPPKTGHCPYHRLFDGSAFEKAIQAGRAPALKFFLENGHYEPEVVNAYPTMSVSIDSTLLTGTYPNIHRVPGLVWYNQDEQRIVNYGSDKKEIATLGIKQTIEDGIFSLNHRHLSRKVTTVHDDLQVRGKQSASINGLIYRGPDRHELNIPPPLKKLKLMPEHMTVNGPALFRSAALPSSIPITPTIIFGKVMALTTSSQHRKWPI